MTTVEVLAPLRLETRFVPPEARPDGSDQWMLRVRIYPDEFSMHQVVTPPSTAELDRLTELVTAPLDERAAFTAFARGVGAGRALWLWRRCVRDDGAGHRTVDRTGEVDGMPLADSLPAHGPAGLPEQLQLWLVHADGTRTPAPPLVLDLAGIGADLDLAVFRDEPRMEDHELPGTWWLSYQRACDVGLGIDLDVGTTPPDLDALVVVGLGSADAAGLVDEHSRGNRLAVLPAGTPTNTVHGEPTTDLGASGETLYPLLHADPAAQPSATAVLTGLTGRVAADALPMLSGSADDRTPGALAVQAFWPVLWGRGLRDVAGAGGAEIDVAGWAERNLAVQGPRTAFRVGDQPYGLLPTSVFELWADEPGDVLAGVEDQILRWAIPWRAGAAAAARAANHRVHGADTAGLLQVLGGHAPSRHWRARPIAGLALVATWRALAGMPPWPATDWDRLTADAWRGWPYPQAPIAPAARSGPVPGPPADDQDDHDRLIELIRMEPEELYHGRFSKLGLIGHLFREAMICARAILGEARGRADNGQPIDLGAPLPLDDEDTYRNCVMQGGDHAMDVLFGSGDPNAPAVVQRYKDVTEALTVFADLRDADPDAYFRATLAALDAAAFRVDPWLTGVAERRLQRMIAADAPFKLGAYGWVDAPSPFTGADPAVLAPGPTAGGLLHAPSPAQALTSAVLRDAAVRQPGDDRWQLAIDSAKVRHAVKLAERVRLGVHLYEALGLEVEKVAGDWDSVRILRTAYPLAPDQQLRRVCDGAAVLAAARDGSLAALIGPAGLAPDLPSRLAPLDQVLDTYADLLVADGVYALVTGHAELANAAMEASAGFGPPPELRAIRTPRAAATVRVAAWAVLPPGPEAAPDAGTDPVAVADPAFAALTEAGEDPARMSALLNGGDEAPVPSLTGGAYAGLGDGADADLRLAVATDLDDRLVRMRQLASADRNAVAALDPADPDVVAAGQRWRIDVARLEPAEVQAAVLSALTDRLTASNVPAVAATPSAGGAGRGVPDAAVNARRQALRILAGRPGLPILPVVDAALLPTLTPAPDLDSTWLEIVAAVRPRLAPLEAHQFGSPWPMWLSAVGGTDPWTTEGPVLTVFAPGAVAGRVAIAVLDAWTDSVPSRRHATTAAFGFNAPKSRAPQAVLLAVPPDPTQRLDIDGLLDVVLETRELVHARAARPTDRAGLPYATPGPLVHATPANIGFLNGWPQ